MNRTFLLRLVAALKYWQESSLRHKHGRCDEYDNGDDYVGIETDRLVEECKKMGLI